MLSYLPNFSFRIIPSKCSASVVSGICENFLQEIPLFLRDNSTKKKYFFFWRLIAQDVISVCPHLSPRFCPSSWSFSPFRTCLVCFSVRETVSVAFSLLFHLLTLSSRGNTSMPIAIHYSWCLMVTREEEEKERERRPPPSSLFPGRQHQTEQNPTMKEIHAFE